MNPTQARFIADQGSRLAYMGPAGVAKTSTGVAKVMMSCLLEPGSKSLIARADYNDLEDTTMLRAREMLGYLPPGTLLDSTAKPPEKWWIRPAVQKGPSGEEIDEPSQITFMGLSDVLGSYEFSNAFIDEAAEVDKVRVDEVGARLRWIPHHLRNNEEAKANLKYWLAMSFNPPVKSHWLHEACTGLSPEGDLLHEPTYRLYLPQKEENNRNLPPNYHELLAADLPDDLKQRLIEGAWGSTFPGLPVIPQFRLAMHGRLDIKFAGGTLFRFFDFGFRRPCCLWVQVTNSGQLQVMREFLGHNMTGEAFIAKVIALTNEHYEKRRDTVDYGDPAVAQVKDTGSMLTLLRQAGLNLRYQRVAVDLSLKILRKHFETLINGEPKIIIDSRHAPHLCAALGGGYHFKRDGITPHKDEFYDHEVDALRYGDYNLFGTNEGTTTSTMPVSIAPWENRL